MSKMKSVGKEINAVGWGNAYVIHQDAPDRLFGLLFNIIEALGLPEKQEEALKPLVRKQIWEVFEEAINISSERHSEIRNLYYQKRNETQGANVPMSAI